MNDKKIVENYSFFGKFSLESILYEKLNMFVIFDKQILFIINHNFSKCLKAMQMTHNGNVTIRLTKEVNPCI